MRNKLTFLYVKHYSVQVHGTKNTDFESANSDYATFSAHMSFIMLCHCLWKYT